MAKGNKGRGSRGACGGARRRDGSGKGKGNRGTNLLLLAVMVLSILLLLEVMVYTVADEIVTFLAKLHIIRM